MRSRLAAAAALLATALVAGPAATGAAAQAPDASFTYALPGERVFPEGIAVDEAGGRFFVSSTTDGTILTGRVADRAATPFLPGGADGRTTAIGLKVSRGRLYVAGGATGSVWVYDLATRALVRRFDTGTGGFLNDIAIAPDGDAYVTDSRRPHLYRISGADVRAGRGDTVALRPFTAYPAFVPGVNNANGIVAPDDRTLVYVNSARGELVRVALDASAPPAFSLVDLGGATVASGDGLLLRSRTLSVLRNAQGFIATFTVTRDLRSARLRATTFDSTFRFPTTAAETGGRYLVVNSQFDKRSAMQPPELPFTVSSIRRPR